MNTTNDVVKSYNNTRIIIGIIILIIMIILVIFSSIFMFYDYFTKSNYKKTEAEYYNGKVLKENKINGQYYIIIIYKYVVDGVPYSNEDRYNKLYDNKNSAEIDLKYLSSKNKITIYYNTNNPNKSALTEPKNSIGGGIILLLFAILLIISAILMYKYKDNMSSSNISYGHMMGLDIFNGLAML